MDPVKIGECQCCYAKSTALFTYRLTRYGHTVMEATDGVGDEDLNRLVCKPCMMTRAAIYSFTSLEPSPSDVLKAIAWAVNRIEGDS